MLGLRSRSLCFRRNLSTAQSLSSFTFPYHTRPVFVHKLEGVSLNALSFSLDPSAASAQIGWSPHSEPLEMYRQFKENAAMKKEIFETIKNGLTDSGWAKDMAATYGSGWMHIPDGRTLAPFGRCPDSEDIFATVMLSDGKMVQDRLEQMPTHRLLTINGLFKLPADFEEAFFKNINVA